MSKHDATSLTDSAVLARWFAAPREVVILSGLPASGKSSHARQMMRAWPGVYKRVNRDALREMLDFGEYSEAAEAFVRRIEDQAITLAVADGHSVIVDDTNLTARHFQHIRDLVASFAISVRVVRIDTPIEECIARDAERLYPVGEQRIRQMAGQRELTAPADAPAG